jgi:hypothetical protein
MQFFPSVAAAQFAAVKLAGELARRADKFWNTRERDMSVTSNTGVSPFALRFVGTQSRSIRACLRSA